MKSRPSKPASSPKKNLARKDPPARKGTFPIVAIGASAGGLEAFKEFFRALPSDTGMGFVLIQHLDPSHESMLTEIIAKATTIPVEEVRSGTPIRPNHVYVIPPNTLMALAGGIFQLSPRGKTPGQHLPVNFFMHSLARERKSGAIGIVLSGTGTDGTAGMEEIKAEGGITFAQSPATAKYDGMPRSAIDSGCADFILAPKEMAKELRRIQHHPYVHLETQDAESEIEQPGGGESDKGEPASDKSGPEEHSDDSISSSHARDFGVLLTQLRKASGVDFSQYKPNTIHRRSLRRMLLLKIDSLREYGSYLKEHPEESQKLYEDVLIPVTSFFRDFEAFESLKTQVYPAIVKDKANKGTIRMWAPGCSTGEETYSLAMTLLEFLGDRASSFQVQIFGTDLNEKSIQKARTGVYRESIAEEISQDRLARFFVKVEDGYRVNKAVRDMCVFARQNVANDPPFSQMNVVACRNLLIYIQPVLQKKIIPVLHYALKPSGFLVLGSSESVSTFPELFSTVDKKHKIYAKKATASRLHYDFVQSYYPAQSALSIRGQALKSQFNDKDELDVQAEADRLVLREHAPAGVVINRDMEVVQFRGQTTPYLAPPPGKPSMNVLKLARNGLAIELRALITAAAKKDAAVRKDSVAFDENGHKRTLNLSVTPLGEKGAVEKGARNRDFFLILFDDVTPLWTPPKEVTAERRSKGRGAGDQETRRLKQELAGTRDALRSAIESEDSLREEFQSANEEILSANEELQSTNEELETSKEELQSANEELGTLNAELRVKNTELHDLSNDISNLLNSTRIPVVMLDRRLHIRRITPSASGLFAVRPADVGRPFTDIKLNIDMASYDLEMEIGKVLDNLQPVEREVRDLDGRWHALSILPYRTQDNKIDGAVLALQDIDAIKSARDQLARSNDFFRGISDTVREPLLVLDADLRVISANESFLNTFKVSSEQTSNRLLYDLGNGQWQIPALRKLLERVLPEKQIVTDFEVEHDFETIGTRTMLLNARTLVQPNQSQPMILLAIEDITERKHSETALARLAAIVECSDEAIIAKSVDGVIQSWNRAAERLFGYTAQEAVGRSVTILMPPERVHEESEILERIRRGEHIEHYESIRRRKDGSLLPVSLTISPIFDQAGRVVGASKIARDISGRKLTEAALIRSEKLATAGRLAATLAHEINNPLQAITNLVNIWARSPGLDAQGQAHAAMAESELRRVSHLTQQSLSFYRESSVPTPVNVEEVIDSVFSIYDKRIQAKKIRVMKRYRLNGTTVKTYPGEIRQVFSTLLLNAMEAVDTGGAIAVRTRKTSHLKNRAIRGIRVTISDNGVGIPASNISRIFDPFFTTKGDNGTGLGLWVASGIIDRAGGSILTRSSVRPGKSGTCFSIFFPAKT
ncbi:chemotaxis protein CheB [Acidicapsa dinghuensis]|uniref:histidine kinase n=1 Tax=Acidicapsa dinghuensis TaxID=2218256 RepID=A0ABW1EFR8_9BACT|nr:chemotaxis protein CheB [Acidicapsa dinghuensis]